MSLDGSLGLVEGWAGSQPASQPSTRVENSEKRPADACPPPVGDPCRRPPAGDPLFPPSFEVELGFDNQPSDLPTLQASHRCSCRDTNDDIEIIPFSCSRAVL